MYYLHVCLILVVSNSVREWLNMPKRRNEWLCWIVGKFAAEAQEKNRIVSKPLPSQDKELPKTEKKPKQTLSNVFNK